MRGTRKVHRLRFRQWGIIPAYAGNTRQAFLHVPIAQDHPRVCGEHNVGKLVMPKLAGSSPRMRGTLKNGAHVALKARIIPAYAGNTLPAS